MITQKSSQSQSREMCFWKPRGLLSGFYTDTGRHQTWMQQTPSNRGCQTTNHNQDGEIFCWPQQLFQNAH